MTNKQVSRRVSHAQLESLIEHVMCHGVAEAKNVLTRLNARLKSFDMALLVSKKNREGVTIAQLRGWLHPDPRKRTEPGFGIGLLLVEVWKQISNKD